MVDALQEGRRTLAENGMLLDLRPAICRPDIEVMTSKQTLTVGFVDDSSAAADRDAADSAIKQALEAGWLVAHRRFEFDFERYWDNVLEMASFLETRRHKMLVKPSLTDVQSAYDAISAQAAGDVLLRVRWRNTLTSYVARNRAVAP